MGRETDRQVTGRLPDDLTMWCHLGAATNSSASSGAHGDVVSRRPACASVKPAKPFTMAEKGNLMKTVYTIGYEGTDIERFVQTLTTVGVEAVADVRAVPLSRKKGFSKNSLRDYLDSAGIKYLPMQELGDPKEGREAAKFGDYDRFRTIYSAHVDLPESVAAIEKLAITSQELAVCLLCFERDPKTCHRFIVGERMGAFGYKMLHLFGDDPERYLRHQDKLPKRAGSN
jgi:hypothetical protein